MQIFTFWAVFTVLSLIPLCCDILFIFEFTKICLQGFLRNSYNWFVLVGFFLLLFDGFGLLWWFLYIPPITKCQLGINCVWKQNLHRNGFFSAFMDFFFWCYFGFLVILSIFYWFGLFFWRCGKKSFWVIFYNYKYTMCQDELMIGFFSKQTRSVRKCRG